MDEISALFSEPTDSARPIHLVPAAQFETWLRAQPETVQTFLGERGKGGIEAFSLFAGVDGKMEVLVVPADGAVDEAFAVLSGTLPSSIYRLNAVPSGDVADSLMLAWGRGAYKFRRDADYVHPRIVWPEGVDRIRLLAMLEVTWLVRDLINTPAGQMGPAELQQAVERISARFGGCLEVIEGEDLIKKGFGSIHAIGRASSRAPRLIDLRWGNPDDFKLTLIGKGVCFDTGGYNLKGSPSISEMKIDMGGAAQVIGLAHLAMALDLPVCLRLLIPAVDNVVGGNAVFPGDTVMARNGKLIEIADTDSEGRVILADTLVEACAEKPDLVVDFATLTGAARAALGADIQALFCNDDRIAEKVVAAGMAQSDYVWRLPLHAPYRAMLKSNVADLSNSATGPLASFAGMRLGGAIQAALFLEQFVQEGIKWAHFDILSMNVASRPGRPCGGEAVGIWALLSVLEERLGQQSKNQQPTPA